MDNNIGKIFGKWTVIEFSYKDKYNHPFYKCKCECGLIKDVDIFRLKYGHSTSCRRCGYNKHIKPSHIKRLRRIFYNMKQRCYNPKNPKFKDYGQRGIIICDEWYKDSESFIIWSLNHGYDDKLSIDRKNNNENYCPENCRWVDMKTQQNNKNNNHLITYQGKEYTISTFCSTFNLDVHTISQRINRYGFKDAELLLRKSLNGYNRCKIFVSLNGKTKSLVEWCKEYNLIYESVYNRIHRYGYTPEQAILTPIKK